MILDNQPMTAGPDWPDDPLRVSSPGSPHTFRAYAHRGGAAENPENSPAAFAHAVALGYTHLETDIRPSRDGVAVLHHDSRLDRTTDGTGPVRDQTWANLSILRLSDGSALLRLEELLESHPHTFINVDVKEPGSVPATVAAIARCRAWSRVCLTSFSGRRLARARRLASPGTESAAHPGEVLALRAALPWPRRPMRLQIPPTLLGRRLIDAEFIERAHARGYAVDVWTIDDRAKMEALIDAGVDGIMTDRPTLLREVLLVRGRWPESPDTPDSNTCS